MYIELRQMHGGYRLAHYWFLEFTFFSRCIHVCVHRDSILEALNYIHVIFNLNNKLSKLGIIILKYNEAILCMGIALVMKDVVTETKLIRLW